MASKIQKMIVVPVDGSDAVFRNLDYIDIIFGPKHNLKVTLFYVLPGLPSILVEEAKKSGGILTQLKNLEDRNADMAERLLAVGKKRLTEMGFAGKMVEGVFKKIEVGIARFYQTNQKSEPQPATVSAESNYGGFAFSKFLLRQGRPAKAARSRVGTLCDFYSVSSSFSSNASDSSSSACVFSLSAPSVSVPGSVSTSASFKSVSGLQD